ncbi:phosphoinositide 3-kinase regulatory subunit 6 isoform X2 [Electrophorus electricus]|uniref:phosphoinositide 3-kinase regulatory subunit 6 isoform X2 n=1 Tax=Electrophorus electricus TaxID=8005 RepID=UPI0015D0A0F0|nr:phosphoinositide 3-kinase regulatory subunit 6 isoform X2 [Electrophorus electricus]
MAVWVQCGARPPSYAGMDSAEFTLLESDMYRILQNVLRELNTEQLEISKVMLRLTFHQKVHSNPLGCLALVRVAIRELERAERFDLKPHIIPLLHTLVYTLLQAVYVPEELYRRLYGSCKRLLTFPQPFCTVGLSYTRLLKAEISTPGLMYQRTLVSEHSLRNEQYPLQERVFVFADPAVFSESLGSLLRADIEGGSQLETQLGYMRSVVQHSLQATLGDDLCHGPSLTQALQEQDQDVESYFLEVLAAMEQSAVESKNEQSVLTKRLQQLYTQLLHSTGKDTLSRGSLADIPLPNPDMSFHMWWEEEELWREIAKFVRSSSTTDSFCLSADEFEVSDLSSYFDSDTPRLSVLSTDSGIERDMPPTDSSDTEASGVRAARADQQQGSCRLTRRIAKRIKPSASDSMALMQDALEESAWSTSTLQRHAWPKSSTVLKSRRNFTANVVVVGDDRSVGRLAGAYYRLRKMEARKLFLTAKVNIKLFYIPFSTQLSSPGSPSTGRVSPKDSNPCALGSYLGMLDPWYDFNVCSQGQMIPQLATSDLSRQNRNKSFFTDIISYYVRMGQQPVYFTVYYVKIVFCDPDKSPKDDVFISHLSIDFPEYKLRHGTLKDVSFRQKKGPAETCGGLVSLIYKKVSLSNRETEKGLSLRTTGVQMSAVPTSKAEDLNRLTVDVNEMNPKSSLETKIRTCNLKLKTQERIGFTVCLDKDSRRTLLDVQSIEVEPCKEPGYYVQKSMKSKSRLMSEEDTDSGLSKYLNRGLLLPINTFSGIVP